MLILNSAAEKKKILSVHSGGGIAVIDDFVINPASLKIEAFSVRYPGVRFFSVLHSGDIREWNRAGVIINSQDDIIEVAEDMPKIKKLVEDEFKLLGIGVRTESGKRMGKVKSFAFDSESFAVMQLNVEGGGPMSIFKGTTLINRSAIVNVTKKFIIVQDGSEKNRGLAENLAKKKNVEYGFNTSSAEKDSV